MSPMTGNFGPSARGEGDRAPKSPRVTERHLFASTDGTIVRPFPACCRADQLLSKYRHTNGLWVGVLSRQPVDLREASPMRQSAIALVIVAFTSIPALAA